MSHRSAKPIALQRHGNRYKELNRATLNNYADAMALGSQNIVELQNGMNILQRWAEENQLKINRPKQCKYYLGEKTESQKQTISR